LRTNKLFPPRYCAPVQYRQTHYRAMQTVYVFIQTIIILLYWPFEITCDRHDFDIAGLRILYLRCIMSSSSLRFPFDYCSWIISFNALTDRPAADVDRLCNCVKIKHIILNILSAIKLIILTLTRVLLPFSPWM